MLISVNSQRNLITYQEEYKIPAKSISQQQAMAIAEHSPEKLYKRNAALKAMSKSQLHDFASTKRTGLPEHVSHHERTKKHYEGRKSE